MSTTPVEVGAIGGAPPRASFLGIPPELRLIIFEIALPTPQTIADAKTEHCCEDHFPRDQNLTALLHVNKRVREKALPIYYTYVAEKHVTFRTPIKTQPSTDSWRTCDCIAGPEPSRAQRLLLYIPDTLCVYNPLPNLSTIALDDTFSNVKHVRVHCDMGQLPWQVWVERMKDITDVDFGAIVQLANLPRLESMHLQVHVIMNCEKCVWPSNVELPVEELCRTAEVLAREEVEAEMEKCGKVLRLDVDTGCMYCRCCTSPGETGPTAD